MTAGEAYARVVELLALAAWFSFVKFLAGGCRIARRPPGEADR